MNYTDLIDKIAADNQISKTDARNNMNMVVAAITSVLVDGDEVRISSFGTFKNKRVEASKGRNPSTGQEIDIPARNVVRFKPSSTLVTAVNG